MRILFLLIAIFPMLSAAQVVNIKVEIPRTPKFEVSDSIQSILLLNRSLTPEFKNYNEDSVQVKFLRANFTAQAMFMDSTVSDTTLKALAELLYESERFDVVIPVDNQISRFLPYQSTPKPLSWDYLNILCERFNTQSVLVLENQVLKAVTKYEKFWVEDYRGSYKMHHADIEMYYRNHWRLYDPKNEAIIVDYTTNDTLFWSGEEPSISGLFNTLPSIKNAAKETGIYSALDFAEVIAPTWYSDTRSLFSFKDETIDKAIELAQNNLWDEAINIWLGHIDEGKNSFRSKVMHNIAISYEMLGDLESAKEWGLRSYNLKYNNASYLYLKKLSNRINRENE